MWQVQSLSCLGTRITRWLFNPAPKMYVQIDARLLVGVRRELAGAFEWTGSKETENSFYYPRSNRGLILGRRSQGRRDCRQRNRLRPPIPGAGPIRHGRDVTPD